MQTYKYKGFLLLLALCCSLVTLQVKAQDADPGCSFTTSDGKETDYSADPQNAPLTVHFLANPQPEDLDGYSARWEWKIWNKENTSEVLVHRFDQNLDYTFTESGTFCAQLYATFTLDGDTITYPEEGSENPITITISESKLEMPNAFSPNGDGYNDVYNAKSGYQSIISFKATIFNRWGQKIYSWDNPDREQAGWDGKWHGHTVHDGVYYVVVNAKGADGTDYKIRRDVNVLTGYDNSAKEGTSTDE